MGMHQKPASKHFSLHFLQAWHVLCEGISGEPWHGWYRGKHALQRLIRKAPPQGPLLASSLQLVPQPSGMGAPTHHGSELFYPAACPSTTIG